MHSPLGLISVSAEGNSSQLSPFYYYHYYYYFSIIIFDVFLFFLLPFLAPFVVLCVDPNPSQLCLAKLSQFFLFPDINVTFKLPELFSTSRMSMFLSLIPTHLLPSIHLHAGGKALLCVAPALLDLSFFHLVEFRLFFQSPLFSD